MQIIKYAENIGKISEIRRPECNDLAERKGVITSESILIKNYPKKHPATAFNPALLVHGNKVFIYARIILGYYKYVSAIARLDLDLDDIDGGYLSRKQYSAKLVIWPDNEYDIWGTEDPRVQRVYDKFVMVYTGRTSFYFSPTNRERTVPIVAVAENPEDSWKKVGYIILPEKIRRKMISNKDTVLLGLKDTVFILHRPHIEEMPLCLWIGKISREEFESVTTVNREGRLSSILVDENEIVMLPSEFEDRLGWSTPPIDVGNEEWIAIAHAKGKDEVYRLFAVLLERDGENIVVKGVTPYYIMEPREVYEKYGDRPLVVFACGAEKVKDRILISYGAADCFIALAEFCLSDLLAEMREVR